MQWMAAAIAVLLSTSQAQAGCLERVLLVTRYHYPVPSTTAINWQEVYRFDLAGNTTTRLSAGVLANPQYDTTGGAFSPDGSRVAIAVADDGGVNGKLFSILPQDTDGDLEGDDPHLLAAAAETPDVSDWGNGGLLYSIPDANGDWQIYNGTTNATGTGLTSSTALTSGHGYRHSARWTETASHVVFAIDITDPKGIRRLGIDAVDVVSGTVSSLTAATDIVTGTAVRQSAGQVVYPKWNGADFDLWLADLDLSGTPQLANEQVVAGAAGFSEHTPSISTDGACLAYLGDDLSVSNSPNSDLYIYDFATGQSTRITITKDVSGATFMP